VRPLSRCLTILAILGGPALAHADDGSIRLDIVVELTEAGRKLANPSPELPAYYFPLPVGYQEVGDVVTFYHRGAPPAAAVEGMIAKALAKQGYLVMNGRHKPSLVLLLSWGYVCPIYVGSGKDRGNSPFSPSPRATFVNEAEMMTYTVGDNYNYRSASPNARAEEATEATRVPRWFVRVAAADFDDWRYHHKITLLWRAHVTTAIWGHYLDEVLAEMIEKGLPLAGRETNGPVFFTGDALPEGTVIVGTPNPKAEAKPK
jgi:hypothetical protein